jgi:hypothetical protein
MDRRDQAAIEELFDRIAEVERRSGPRDREAEAHIRSLIARHPAAPYYMAQTIIVQEQALNEAQRRIEELEQRLSPASEQGGFLGGLFGGGRTERGGGYRETARRGGADYGPWDRPGMGGGFLAGAAQTAMGVAGGVVLGSMISDWLSPDQAMAAGEGDVFADQGAADAQVADAGDIGGDFDFGDF